MDTISDALPHVSKTTRLGTSQPLISSLGQCLKRDDGASYRGMHLFDCFCHRRILSYLHILLSSFDLSLYNLTNYNNSLF